MLNQRKFQSLVVVMVEKERLAKTGSTLINSLIIRHDKMRNDEITERVDDRQLPPCTMLLKYIVLLFRISVWESG